MTEAAYVRGSRADEQLLDVLDRFDPPRAPWSRCPACNGRLEPVANREVQHLLEPGTRRSYQQFSRCQACGRPYWRGAHARHLDAIVATATRLAGKGQQGPLPAAGNQQSVHIVHWPGTLPNRTYT